MRGAVSVDRSLCGLWLWLCTLSRLRHFQTLCMEMPKRPATIQGGSVLAWIAARLFGIVVACL